MLPTEILDSRHKLRVKKIFYANKDIGMKKWQENQRNLIIST
jgi:hypothetical protein